MSGYLWKATVRNVNRALKEVNAFEWEGDYRFEARNRLKELLEGGMATEVEQQLGRERYERRESEDKEDYRNGSYLGEKNGVRLRKNGVRLRYFLIFLLRPSTRFFFKSMSFSLNPSSSLMRFSTFAIP